jgi:DNA primase
MDTTKSDIREERNAILVEGYTDLLQIYQSGIKNVVAVSGTALTQNHVNQLGKFTKKVSVLYDGDEAGIRAAIRAGYILLRGSVEPAMVEIPDGIDPDDWIQAEGAKPIESAIKHASSLLKFHLNSVSMDTMSAAERSELIKDILREISGIKDPVVRDDFLKSLASSAKLDDIEIIRMFKSQIKRKRAPNMSQEKLDEPDLFTTVETKAQAEIVKIIATQDSKFIENFTTLFDINIFTNPLLKKLADFIIAQKGEVDIPELLDQLDEKNEREKISALFMEDMDLMDSDQALKECIRTLKRQKLKEQIKSSRIALRDVESSGGDGSEYLNKIARLQKELDDLV